MNNKNIKINLTKHKSISIDKKILPLFSTPVILKNLSEKRRNKYNINIINAPKNLTYKKIRLEEILNLFLKGIQIYNKNLNHFLNTLKFSKLELILRSKNDDNYKFNSRLSNYHYKINKFLPIFKINSLLYNINLFLPKQLLKPEPYIRFSYHLRYITKIYLDKLIYKKKNLKMFKRELKNLLKKGQRFINQLDKKIIEKTQLIKIEEEKINNKIQNNIKKKKDSLNITNIPKKQYLKINKIKKKIINRFENINKTENKINEIKIIQTIKSILKNKSFDFKTDPISVHSNPVAVLYSNYNNNDTFHTKKKPLIHQYLKSLSIYNMKHNGIFIHYSNIISFNFNTNKWIKNIYTLLAASFKSMYCLISKPVFVMTQDKIIIQLFYYLFIPNVLKYKKIHKYGHLNNSKLSKNNWFKRKKRIRKQYRKFRKIKINVRIQLRKLSNVVLTKIFTHKFKKLCDLLSHLFKKPVQLDLIRLHYPYKDSQILVNLLAIMINKIKLRIIFRKLFEKAVIKNVNKLTDNNKVNILPAFLSGINIKVAGRLLTHKVIPRKTVKFIKRGSSAPGKINFSDVARYTHKNKRGAYSITVLSGQNLN